jgi:anti-sigma factor RsiW
MSSTCGAVRRELLSVTGPRDHDASLAEAQAHVEQCASCRRFLTDMHAIRDATRAAAGGDTAPAEVRERLFASIATARTDTTRKKVVRAAQLSIAAAAVVAAIAVFDIGRSREVPSEFVSAITQEHATAVSGDRHESSDAEELQRWLAARLPFAVFVPVLEEAQLIGARISLTPRGRGAVVEYAVGSEAVSYFILPSQSGGMPEPGRFRHAHAAGYRAVMWSEMGLMHAMVGALPQPTLERLARDCIKQATRSGRMAFSSSRTPYS